MVNFKDIITGDKKVCGMCDKIYNSGIIIGGSNICEDCVKEIINSDATSEGYSLLVEKIKSIVIKEL